MAVKKKSPGPRRSLLFVPGNRPERFDKACASGADIVCIDLEDAVSPVEKIQARQELLSYLQHRESGDIELAVRINAFASDYGNDDMQLLSGHFEKLDFVMLPKAEAAADIKSLSASMADASTEIIALIETPPGLLNLKKLLMESDCISMLMLGGADLSAAMSAKMNWDSLLYARGHIITCAALKQLGTIDVPFLDVNDDERLRQETTRLRDMGFTTKAAIHPKQVGIINDVLTPTDTDIETALKVIEADIASAGSAVLLDGKMIDAPLVHAAQRIVRIAESLGKISIN